MRIIRVDGKLRVRISAKELVLLIISKFFSELTKKIVEGSYNASEISTYVKELAKDSVDSTDYEFFTSILDLYEQFEKNCDFCFNLKNSFDLSKNKIVTLDDLSHYREDPPDVIVYYQNNYYEFELKRYRDSLTFESLYDFVKKKIISHYSGKSNYLVILQPAPYSGISFDIFKKLHEIIKKGKKQPGIIGFSLNNNNKEIILIRVFPELEIAKRKFNSEVDIFAEILHSE